MEPRVIADRYELVEQIGSGGMAAVWQADDLSLGRPVAIKLLHPAMSTDQGLAERLRREARHAASLSHPNVVTVYDTGEDDGTPFIVMELVDGRSLHAVLEERGPLPVAETARIGRGVLGALDHAHRRGIVHRDVKPGNILITPAGEVKVTDFGIAKELEEASSLTQTGTLVGTASYISPEQAAGRPATQSSDLYALGCVLYECLTGSPPFRGTGPVATALAHQREAVPPLRPRRPDVPPALDAVVMRSLEKDPSQRFANAAEMDTALAQTDLDLADDVAPTLVAPVGPAPTERVRVSGTEVLPTIRRAPRRAQRVFTMIAILLIAGAAIWLGALLASTLVGDDPEPTPLPTAEPLPTATPRPVDTPPPATPTAELTPAPVITPAAPRTPRRPTLPGIDFEETPPPEPTEEPGPGLGGGNGDGNANPPND